jgi:hypothetical protein
VGDDSFVNSAWRSTLLDDMLFGRVVVVVVVEDAGGGGRGPLV